jgi:hypothetical protein
MEEDGVTFVKGTISELKLVEEQKNNSIQEHSTF